MVHKWQTRALVTVGAVALLALGAPRVASADPIGAGTASSFAITAALNGTEVIPPTPTAEATAPPFGKDVDATLIPVPAAPLAVSGTLVARAAVHPESDIPTALEQSAQTVKGPYNAQAVGQVEDLLVLIDEGVPGGQLLNADLIRGEAVAVCTAGAVQYSAESEVVNLQIGDQDPLSGPLNDIVDQITEGISASPLADVIDVDVNVLTVDANGASVDALVVTVLAAAGDVPLAQIRIGHAEVKGAGCAAAALPECSDTVDNADAEDELADAADPGCHTGGDATVASDYDPNDDDETDVMAAAALPSRDADSLPATGSSVATGLAATLSAAALGLFALRRRLI